MTDWLVVAAFLFFALLTVGSAIVVVFARSLIHSAYALFFTLFGVAGLYALLGADFLAAAQLLVYVGGILVLILFGVMLTNRIYGAELRTGTYQLVPGLVAYLVLATLLLRLLFGTGWFRGPEAVPGPTTAEIGKLFLSRYLLPFEVASVLLLAALVGAVMLVRGRPGEAEEEEGEETATGPGGERR